MKRLPIITILLISTLSTSYSQSILTDNPLKSRLDSLVDKSVAKYFSDAGAVGLSIGIIKNGRHFSYNYGETKKGQWQAACQQNRLLK